METEFTANGLKFSAENGKLSLKSDLTACDRAVRKSTSLGRVNVNPKRSDCLSYYDKRKGVWVNNF